MALQLLLDVEVELLHVGPSRLVGNGDEAQREAGRRGVGRISDIRVPTIGSGPDDVDLRRALQQRRGLTFHTLGVGLVSVGMLKEDPVAAANGSLGLPCGIPGKPDAGRRVEQLSVGAANRRDSAGRRIRESREGSRASWTAALHKPNKRVTRAGNQRTRASCNRTVSVDRG